MVKQKQKNRCEMRKNTRNPSSSSMVLLWCKVNNNTGPYTKSLISVRARIWWKLPWFWYCYNWARFEQTNVYWPVGRLFFLDRFTRESRNPCKIWPQSLKKCSIEQSNNFCKKTKSQSKFQHRHTHRVQPTRKLLELFCHVMTITS